MTHFTWSWIEFLSEAREGYEMQSYYTREKLENKKG